MLLALWGGFFEWDGATAPSPSATAFIGSSKKKSSRVRASDMVASSFPEIDTRAQRMKRNAAIFTILH